MRFKTFFLTENALENILKMFGTETPGAGAATFGAGVAAGGATPQTGGVTTDAPAGGVNPKLLSITGATPAQKADVAIKAIHQCFKNIGKDPAVMPMKMDRAAILAAYDSGKRVINTLDQEGVGVFANTVNPKDLEEVLGAQRMQNIQQPQQQAVAAAAQAGAGLAGQ